MVRKRGATEPREALKAMDDEATACRALGHGDMPERSEVFAVSVLAAHDDGRCAVQRPALNGSVVARVTAVIEGLPRSSP